MKYSTRLLLIVIFALLVAGCAASKKTKGTNDAHVPFGTQTILIEVEASADEAYRKAASVFQEQNYTFSSTDEAIRSFSTENSDIEMYLNSPSQWARFDVSVSETDSSASIVRLRGYTSQPRVGENEEQIVKAGRNVSVSNSRKGWQVMYLFAERIGNPVEFLRR